MKKIMIDIELFMQIWRYFELGDENHIQDIKDGLNEKFDAMYRHELYSKAKQGDEEARQKYLDEVGMHKDFRWSSGTNPAHRP